MKSLNKITCEFPNLPYIIIIFIAALNYIRNSLFFNFNLQSLGEPTIPPYVSMILSDELTKLTIWDQNNFGYQLIYETGIIRKLSLFSLASLGFDGAQIYNLLILLFSFISGVGIFFLINKITNRKFPSLIGAIFYMFSPFIFHHIIFGHLNTLISYSLAPWAIFYFLKYISSKEKGYLFISIIIFALTAQMVNFLPMMFIIILFLIILSDARIKDKVWLFVYYLLFTFSINLYWILPTLLNFSKGYEFLETAEFSLNKLVSMTPNTTESAIGIGFPFKLYSYSLGSIEDIWIIFATLIIVGGFLSLIFYSHKNQNIRINRYVLIFTILSLITLSWLFIFRTPFSNLAFIIYSNVPLMSFFRNVTHLQFIYSLSLSILIGNAIAIYYLLLPQIIPFRRKHFKKIFSITIIVSISLYSYPFLTGNFGDIDIEFNYPEDQEKIINFIDEDNEDYRVILLPMDSIVHYKNKNYPPDVWSRDPFINRFSKPTFTLHSFEENSPQFNLIVNIYRLIQNKDNDIGIYLSKIGVKYIILRSDPIGIINYNINETRNFFDLNDNFSLRLEDETFWIYENLIYDQSWRFVSYPTMYVDEYYQSLIKKYLLFVDITELNNLDTFSDILIPPSYEYHPFNMINSDEIIHIKPVFHTSNENPFDGWNKGWSSSWYNWINLSKFSLNPSISFKSNSEINIPFEIKNSQNYSLLINYFTSKNCGSIGLTIGKNNFIINTKDNIEQYIWKKIDLPRFTNDKQELIIENIDGYNAVNSIFIISDQQYLQMKNFLFNTFEGKNLYYLLNGENIYMENARYLQNKKSVQLFPDGKVWTNINILKEGNYNLSIKGNGSLKIYIGGREFETNSVNSNYSCFNNINLKQGISQLIMEPNPSTNYLLKDYNFEKLQNLSSQDNFNIKNDLESYNGNFSLLVNTTNVEGSSWSWIILDPIEVQENNRYNLITHMKYENVKQSHIVIEGYNNLQNKWIQIDQIPSGKDGTSNWSEFRYDLVIPTDITKIRVILNAGSVLNSDIIHYARTWFDDIRVYSSSPTFLEEIWLYSNQKDHKNISIFETENKIEILKQEKIDVDSYKFKLFASDHFTLSFLESFDKGWNCKCIKNDEISEYDSISIQSGFNGFVINESGFFEIKIEYQPQFFHELGTIISLITLSFCIIYLIIRYLNKKGIFIYGGKK